MIISNISLHCKAGFNFNFFGRRGGERGGESLSTGYRGRFVEDCVCHIPSAQKANANLGWSSLFRLLMFCAHPCAWQNHSQECSRQLIFLIYWKIIFILSLLLSFSDLASPCPPVLGKGLRGWNLLANTSFCSWCPCFVRQSGRGLEMPQSSPECCFGFHRSKEMVRSAHCGPRWSLGVKN